MHFIKIWVNLRKKNDINITKAEYLNEIICNIDVQNEKIETFLNDIEKRNINIIEIAETSKKYVVVN